MRREPPCGAGSTVRKRPRRPPRWSSWRTATTASRSSISTGTRRPSQAPATWCWPTTTGTSAPATESRGRSSIPGCRCATTATRSRSRRRSTASMAIGSGCGGPATPAVMCSWWPRSTAGSVAWSPRCRRRAAGSPRCGACRRRPSPASATPGTPTASSAISASRPRWCRWSSIPPRAARPPTEAPTRGSSSPERTRRPRINGALPSGATRSPCARSSSTRNTSRGRSSSGSRPRRC